jgi:hypothetical protein
LIRNNLAVGDMPEQANNNAIVNVFEPDAASSACVLGHVTLKSLPPSTSEAAECGGVFAAPA